MAQVECAVRESIDAPQKGAGDLRPPLLLLPTLLHATRGRPGTFVEMGAVDGIEGSNTLMLERCFQWRGLLIEANPTSAAKLFQSGRNASMAHSAVCAHNGTIKFLKYGGPWAGAPETMSAGLDRALPRRRHATVDVPCKPLPALLAEHLGGNATIDFFSLDVEEAEAAVLRTVPEPLGALVTGVLLSEVSKFNATKNAMVDEIATAGGLLRVATRLRTQRDRAYVRASLRTIFVQDAFLAARRRAIVPTAAQLYDMIHAGAPSIRFNHFT